MKYVVFAVLFLTVLLPDVIAQTATFEGTVRDANGDLIPGARVSLHSKNGRERVAVTDEDGEYRIGGLTNGEYELRITATGFSGFAGKVTLDDLELVLHDFTLAVGERRYAVTAEIGTTEETSRIPQPISIIGADEIRNRSTAVLAQVAKEEAGLNVQRTSPTIGAIVVRGLTGKNVANYVDGVRYTNGAQRGGINTFFNLTDASNVEAVEVLRGPNSAQYGSDSLGGTVNVLTRSPIVGATRPEFHGEIIPTFNSADRSLGGSGFFSYGTQKFGMAATIAARRINNLRTADGMDSHSAVTRFLGLPSNILYDRNPDTAFTQYGGAIRANYAPVDEHHLSFFYQRGQQDDGKRFDQLMGGDGNLIADLRNLMLDFAYARYLTNAIPFFDSGSFTVSVNSQREERVNQGGQGNPVGDVTHQYERTTATGFSFFLDRRLPARNQFLVGGDAYHEKINSPAYVQNVVAGVTLLSRPRIPDEATFDSAGLFFQNAWDAIPDRLRITGAVRYSGMRYRAQTADAPIVGGRRLWTDDSLRTADFSGRIGGVLRIVDKLRIALNYSRGFRYPSMTDLGTFGLTGDGFEVDHVSASALGGTVGTTAAKTAVSTGLPVVQQRSEYSDNVDLSVRYERKRFSAQFTAFRLEISDTITKQALILPPGAVGQFLGDRQIVSQSATGTVFVADVATPVVVRSNYSTARLHGFEIESEGDITERLTARGNFTFVHAEDKDTGLPPNIEGGTPPPTGFMSLRYSRRRFRLEAYSILAAKQDRLSSLDLVDRRTGAGRSRAQIQNFFRRGACVAGLTTPGATGCNSAGGILIATGETLTQVQNRLLPIGATIQGVTILDDDTVVPLFTYLPSYATLNVRGGYSFNDKTTVSAAFENITDAFYRNPSWGIDGSGLSLTVQLRYRF